MKTRQVAKTARSEATTALPSYRADIDGLRAIAVLLVLVFHFDLIPGNRAGFIGVDVFFVISGYLITSILIRQLDAGSFSFRAFYIARIRRLAPALTATLLLVMAAGVAQLFPDDLRELARQALAAQFYIANLYYWRNVNYFGLGTGNVFLLHMWSLAVEEQFYLLYPLAIVIVHRYAPRRLGLAIALGLVVSLALNVGFVAAKPEATFYLLPTRAWELLTGAMLLFGLRRRRAAAADEGLGVLGVALLVAAVVAYRDDIPFPGFFAMLPVAGAACLLLSGESRPTAVSRLLALAPVTYIGKISYPLYLVHWPVNVLAQRAVGQNYGFAWRLASFMFSFGLAAVLYHAVENPFRHRRILADGRSLLRGYGAGLAATVLAFGVVVATAGLPRRFPAEALRLAGYVNDRSPALTECEFDGRRLQADADFCAIGKPGVRPSWLVYGDSTHGLRMRPSIIGSRRRAKPGSSCTATPARRSRAFTSSATTADATPSIARSRPFSRPRPTLAVSCWSRPGSRRLKAGSRANGTRCCRGATRWRCSTRSSRRRSLACTASASAPTSGHRCLARAKTCRWRWHAQRSRSGPPTSSSRESNTSPTTPSSSRRS